MIEFYEVVECIRIHADNLEYCKTAFDLVKPASPPDGDLTRSNTLAATGLALGVAYLGLVRFRYRSQIFSSARAHLAIVKNLVSNPRTKDTEHWKRLVKLSGGLSDVQIEKLEHFRN